MIVVPNFEVENENFSLDFLHCISVCYVIYYSINFLILA